MKYIVTAWIAHEHQRQMLLGVPDITADVGAVQMAVLEVFSATWDKGHRNFYIAVDQQIEEG